MKNLTNLDRLKATMQVNNLQTSLNKLMLSPQRENLLGAPNPHTGPQREFLSGGTETENYECVPP